MPSQTAQFFGLRLPLGSSFSFVFACPQLLLYSVKLTAAKFTPPHFLLLPFFSPRPNFYRLLSFRCSLNEGPNPDADLPQILPRRPKSSSVHPAIISLWLFSTSPNPGPFFDFRGGSLFGPNPDSTAHPFSPPNHFFGCPFVYRFAGFSQVFIFSSAPFLPAGCFYLALIFRIPQFFVAAPACHIVTVFSYSTFRAVPLFCRLFSSGLYPAQPSSLISSASPNGWSSRRPTSPPDSCRHLLPPTVICHRRHSYPFCFCDGPIHFFSQPRLTTELTDHLPTMPFCRLWPALPAPITCLAHPGNPFAMDGISPVGAG